VYLAREVHLDRFVAIKLLPPSQAAEPVFRERFLREARLAAKLSHPNIIPIHAVEDSGGFVFYVMAFVDGETLTQRVRTRGPLPSSDGARVVREVASALNGCTTACTGGQGCECPPASARPGRSQRQLDRQARTSARRAGLSLRIVQHRGRRGNDSAGGEAANEVAGPVPVAVDAGCADEEGPRGERAECGAGEHFLT
jgi:serine/threonine protein kinase